MVIKKYLYLVLLSSIFAIPAFASGYALFSDSVFLNFDVSTADYVILGPLTLIENKPVIVEKLSPGDWSEYGLLRITNDTKGPVNFYMYVTETDGNICPVVDIKLEVSDKRDGDWETVYEGDIEKIRGNNDRVALTLGENMSKDQIFVRQKVQLVEEADKNDAGKQCLWDEVFRLENKDEDIKEEQTLSRNSLGAYYWIPPHTEVKQPDKYKEYNVEKEINVKWKVKSHTHDKEDLIRINLYLYDAFEETQLLTIAEKLENKGSYKWQPTEDLVGGLYKIKVVAVDGNGLTNQDFSDESFSIVE